MSAPIRKTKQELRELVTAGETQACQLRAPGYVPTSYDKERIAQLLENLAAYGRIALSGVPASNKAEVGRR